jgi:hypothetical protein
MKVDNLDNKLCKTVFVRQAGTIRAVKIPVKNTPAINQHPMFPIERPSADGGE